LVAAPHTSAPHCPDKRLLALLLAFPIGIGRSPTLATIVFDAAIQANHIVGQRTVYGISAEARGRLNAVYMTCIFLCGAVGSSLGSLTYVDGGWWSTALVAAGLGAMILVVFATEYRRA